MPEQDEFDKQAAKIRNGIRELYPLRLDPCDCRFLAQDGQICERCRAWDRAKDRIAAALRASSARAQQPERNRCCDCGGWFTLDRLDTESARPDAPAICDRCRSAHQPAPEPRGDEMREALEAITAWPGGGTHWCDKCKAWTDVGYSSGHDFCEVCKTDQDQGGYLSTACHLCELARAALAAQPAPRSSAGKEEA